MSWLNAVTLIGTLLMLSSRRVAVTTISSRPPPAAGSVAVAVASLAEAAAARQVLALNIRVRKNNNCQEPRRINGFEVVVVIGIPESSYMLRYLGADTSPAQNLAQPPIGWCNTRRAITASSPRHDSIGYTARKASPCAR